MEKLWIDEHSETLGSFFHKNDDFEDKEKKILLGILLASNRH